MKTNFYKIGFFVLLAIMIVGVIYLFIGANKSSTGRFKEEKNVNDTTTTTTANPQEGEYRRLVDSVQMVKDSINLVVSFMNDSIDLKELPTEQRNAYAETFNTLAQINLHMDFKLDNARLGLLKTESEKLGGVIANYDKKKEKLNNLCNKLKSLTAFIKTTIDVLVFAASKGIIVAPQQT